MKAPMLQGPRDVRCEEVLEPRILKPTDAIIRFSAGRVCGADLRPRRGLNPVAEPASSTSRVATTRYDFRRPR